MLDKILPLILITNHSLVSTVQEQKNLRSNMHMTVQKDRANDTNGDETNTYLATVVHGSPFWEGKEGKQISPTAFALAPPQ